MWLLKCDFFLHNFTTDKTSWYLSQFPPASVNISYHIKSEHLEVIRWIAKAEFKIDLNIISCPCTWPEVFRHSTVVAWKKSHLDDFFQCELSCSLGKLEHFKVISFLKFIWKSVNSSFSAFDTFKHQDFMSESVKILVSEKLTWSLVPL